jgi:hypothetical protein
MLIRTAVTGAHDFGIEPEQEQTRHGAVGVADGQAANAARGDRVQPRPVADS